MMLLENTQWQALGLMYHLGVDYFPTAAHPNGFIPFIRQGFAHFNN